MKPLLISFSDQVGGAARASYRLHRALHNSGIYSIMKVRVKQSNDTTIEGSTSTLNSNILKIKRFLAKQLFLLDRNRGGNFFSGNFFPSNWSEIINTSSADVVNLHWIAGETMSIEDIGRIEKPVVWTLHDMWAFSGSEHIADYSGDARWRSGYRNIDESVQHAIYDMDRYVWLRKYKNWNNPVHVVAPSNWLADCARGSALFKDYPISVIPNVLDTDVFREQDMKASRRALGIPLDKRVMLFGSMEGLLNHNKGFDLLSHALQLLEKRFQRDEIVCVVFGQNKPKTDYAIPFSTHWAGHVNDDAMLRNLYNSADLTVVPSRQESFGQIASEALACACPVVTFDTTGLRDIVDHLENGYMAKAFDVEDLAEGLFWVMEKPERRATLGDNGRKKALASWSADVVIPQYLEVYKRACKL